MKYVAGLDEIVEADLSLLNQEFKLIRCSFFLILPSRAVMEVSA